MDFTPMSTRFISGKKMPVALASQASSATKNSAPSVALLPLGAMLLAGSVGAMAQTAGTDTGKTLSTVTVKERAEPEEIRAKNTFRATETTIGKGKQLLRNIPQSVTVVTEKLMDDRNLETMKEVLKTTGGISFLAAEGGEEDIRLRGFALQSTGDVFVDGMRDPAFYDRDTFSLDRVEVLRGSASLLFGRGSTGGAVNMVNKVPRLVTEHEVDLTVGSHGYKRAVGDFNIKTGDNAALRINAMSTSADNNGSGSSIDKKGIAATYRNGIGEKNEISASLYHLDNQNGMNYGMPWIRPTTASPVSATTVLPLDPSAYYGMASDRNAGKATHFTLSHTHRFDRDNEIVTKVRKGAYERDQRAGTVRFGAAATQPGGAAVSLATFGPSTVITRGTQLKIQDLDNLYAQSDFSGKFEALGFKHELQAGVDFAQEEKVVYGARTAAQGGVVPTKPTTTVGRENDGAWLDESVRSLRETSRYKSKGFGAYVQDLVQVAPQWKVLGGLRYDNLTGDYFTYAIPTAAAGPVTTTGYRMKVSEVSKRVGVLYQPNDLHSYHFSAATSFNTSGDAYSLGATNVDTPPEQSINIEFGGKLDSADKQWTTRFAVFRSTKLHERNTDPLVNLVTLSGKRHVAGAEVDVTGRLTPQWEVFGSYMWMPVANIDEGVAGSEGQGTRPSLTPYHSGTVWSTYQVTPKLRVGGGLNFRGRQTPNRNPGWEVPSWVTADLMAEYKFDFDKLTLKANLTNLTNKLYADSLYSGHYIPGAGRMLQVTANIKF
jgi:catecholate siderophore receptor